MYYFYIRGFDFDHYFFYQTFQQAPVAEDEAFEDMEDSIAEIEESKITLRKRFTNCIESTCSNCLDGVFSKFEIFLESKWGPVEELSLYQNTTEVIWTIDAYARCFFPLVFLILQITYWTSYLYLM